MKFVNVLKDNHSFPKSYNFSVSFDSVCFYLLYSVPNHLMPNSEQNYKKYINLSLTVLTT